MSLSNAERVRFEDERDHLLASLDDLDAEFAAGDIDEIDYAGLKDDYTARTAKLTRALDGAKVTRVKAGGTSSSRRLMWIASVLVIAGVAAWAMVQFSGARGTSDTASGEIRLSTVSLLNDAAEEFGQGNVDRAIELYTEVLSIEQTNVEALTYRGWIRYQSGEDDAARLDFDDAVAFDPEYADVRVFRSIVALDAGEFDDAAAEIAAFDAANPTDVALDLVEARQVRERIGVARMAELFDTLDDTEIPDLEAAGIAPTEAQLAGELFAQLEDPQRALRSFDAVLDVDPGNSDAMAWHGWTLALLANSGVEELFVHATEWLDRAIEADPLAADARVFRAFLFNRLGDPVMAREELAVFDSLDPIDQPADMVGLIEVEGLRQALAET